MEDNKMLFIKLFSLCLIFQSCTNQSANVNDKQSIIVQEREYIYWDNLSELQKREVLLSDIIYKDAVAFYEGKLKLTDDNRMFALLDTLTSFKKNNENLNSFYFYVFCQICNISDGSISESLGIYCQNAILNAPEYHLNYFSGNKNTFHKYIQYIGAELYFKEEGTSAIEYNYKDFRKLITEKIASNNTLDSIANLFFLEIEKMMKSMD